MQFNLQSETSGGGSSELTNNCSDDSQMIVAFRKMTKKELEAMAFNKVQQEMEDLIGKVAQEGHAKRTMNVSQTWRHSSFQEQTVANFTRIFEEELSVAKERVEEVLTSAKERVAEEFNLAKERFLTQIKNGIVIDGNQKRPATKSIKLYFKDELSLPILTGDVIQGEKDRFIKVALVDDNTGEVIDNGPLASAHVEIVILRGEFDAYDDWTAQEFDANIVGKNKPLLRGDVLLKLHKGIATFKNLKFQHHTIKIKPTVFSVGAKVVETFDGIRIKEGKTKSFTVKDFRTKYSNKCDTPACSDDVWRLVNICKRGKNHRRLQRMKITTVEDFLIQNLIDPNALKTAVKLAAKKWEATLKHALACPPGNRMYCYMNSQQKRIIVFNLFGKFLRIYPEISECPQSSTWGENREAEVQELLAPCEHIKDIVHFDDDASLHQHVTRYLHVNALESPNPNRLPDIRDNIGTFDMMDTESSNSNRNTNYLPAAYLVDGMDIDAEAQLPSQILFTDQEPLFTPDFIEWLNEFPCPPGETGHEEQLAGTNAVEHSDPEAVNIIEAPTGFRSRLLSAVFFLRKLASIKRCHRPNKMQKVHNCTLG